MEYKKDTNTYLRTKQKDVNTHTWADGDYIPESQYISFVLSRTEKLSAAVYMVTNLITDNEPIKYTLRERTLALLAQLTHIRTRTTSKSTSDGTHLIDALSEIISLLHIACAGQLISEMNYQVLVEEFTHLQVFIADNTRVQTDADSFVHSLFSGDDAQPAPSAQNVKDISKGHKRQENVLYNLKHSSSFKPSSNRTEEPMKHTHTKPKRTHAPNQTKAANEEVKTQRRETILSVVKRQGKVSVKDIAAHITDCSEKTLQRELLALVKDKKLTKEGEKRWSVYRLNT